MYYDIVILKQHHVVILLCAASPESLVPWCSMGQTLVSKNPCEGQASSRFPADQRCFPAEREVLTLLLWPGLGTRTPNRPHLPARGDRSPTTSLQHRLDVYGPVRHLITVNALMQNSHNEKDMKYKYNWFITLFTQYEWWNILSNYVAINLSCIVSLITSEIASHSLLIAVKHEVHLLWQLSSKAKELFVFLWCQTGTLSRSSTRIGSGRTPGYKGWLACYRSFGDTQRDMDAVTACSEITTELWPNIPPKGWDQLNVTQRSHQVNSKLNWLYFFKNNC